ncbi:hypothetical protein niasHT_031219 [Heterodera trifolii]|uniref:Uncharacterized protein n=1 Tax=Heterodera trifolii TaxID=157864 RepID=A0ABD2ICY0_9BILA
MSHQPFANFEIVRLEAMIIGLEIDKEQLQRDIYHLKNRKTQIHNKKIELLQQKEQLIREISVLRETKSSLVNETKDLRKEMLELRDTDGSNDDDTLCAVCYTRKVVKWSTNQGQMVDTLDKWSTASGVNWAWPFERQLALKWPAERWD